VNVLSRLDNTSCNKKKDNMRFVLRFDNYKVEIENSSIYLLPFYHGNLEKGI
jgi:hypothetical protein